MAGEDHLDGEQRCELEQVETEIQTVRRAIAETRKNRQGLRQFLWRARAILAQGRGRLAELLAERDILKGE